MGLKRLGNQRRTPSQARSRATYDAILEAGAQILERTGPDAFNTATVAERAGVSVGSLYQYFPDKAAILLALARREAERAAAGRTAAIWRAMIDLLAGLGGLGATPTTMAPADRPKPRRRPAAIMRRLPHDLWPLAPSPRLQPIPIFIRKGR